jgi:hypothetical protein
MAHRSHPSMQSSMKSIALIGSYLPRQCGIATFTADLAAAILANDPNIDCSIVAMNDRPEGCDFRLARTDWMNTVLPPVFSTYGIQM